MAFDCSWIKNANAVITRHGFESASALADMYPFETYDTLVGRLGREIEPVKVEMLLCGEAIRRGENQRFQTHSFCRYWWKYVSVGWKYDSDPMPFAIAKAVAGWAGPSKDTGKDPFSLVILRLKSREFIQEGWRPMGVEDPVVVRLFEGIQFTKDDFSRIPNEDWMSS